MKKLLIIDDEQDYLNSLAVSLRKKFEISLATNYSSALEELQKGVDIALIDVRLNRTDDNNIDGLKILEWIKMNKPEISAFIMSGYREFSYAEQALNLGAKHFFKKPLDIFSLIAVLQEKG
ncbi:MAG: response regulator [Ignavibacteriales bacterium]|nr:response regulator [Ignavibacteriales bacterium]